MLKQIILIKNIGKFVDVRPPSGNSEFQKLNIYYAENGSGKTTLSAILRSLCTGSPDYILGKKSVFGNGEPEVSIRFEDNSIKKFRSGSWDDILPEIEIFDSRFIHSNIFRGSKVELNHRRNLYQFIIGEQGVSLAGPFHSQGSLKMLKFQASFNGSSVYASAPDPHPCCYRLTV